MSTGIVDQFGRPAYATSGKLYESPGDSGYRLSRPRLDKDIWQLVNSNRHRAMISDCRYIRIAFPVVEGATRQKANYVHASGWQPQFSGEDEEWGIEAEKVTRDADRIISVRGPLYDWNRIWKIGGMMWDTDGDWFLLLSERNGFPRLQTLEAHRVGSRMKGDLVVAGKYKGSRILNGIIYNGAGQEMAYNVLGSSPEQDRQISANDMIRIADPSWFSESRMMPRIAYPILDWYDIKETRNYEKIAQKANSALTMVESNESGKRNVNLPLGNMIPGGGEGESQSEGGPSPSVDILEGGLIRYVKSGSGSIHAHESSRPSQQWQNFDATLLAGAFYGMGWRIEMMDLSKLNGVGVRGFQDNINRTIMSEWEAMEPIVRRVHLWKTAKLIKAGLLRESQEWWKWTFTPPAEFRVDAGRSSQSDREDLRAGTQTHPQVLRKNGRNPREHLEEEALYVKMKRRIAKKHGVNESDLGRSDKPGDNPPTNNNQTEEEE